MKKLKEKTKQIKGITLIALVVTIIVLLILAGVSIAMLTGDNGILGQATNAKVQTEIASEKEAIQLTMINKETTNNSKYDIGKELYDKTLENSNIWDVIVINETQNKYGTGWKYISKDTDIENYGKTKYNWLVNNDTGEFVQLEEGKYTELSYGDELAVTDGLVFNVDSNNMDNSDLSTWGEGVSLHGFDDNTEEITNKGLNFDGKNDYVEFKSTADYSKGFTLSFYGISRGWFLSKQKENDAGYSCRFMLNTNIYSFNTSKNRADSKWSMDDAGNNGNLSIPCSYSVGDVAYFDLTFDAEKNEFKLYKDNEFVDSDIVNEEYWHGENGGEKIMEDDKIYCYLGRAYTGDIDGIGNSWKNGKLTLYSLRLYNRPLNESELKNNYDKTIAAHTIEQ